MKRKPFQSIPSALPARKTTRSPQLPARPNLVRPTLAMVQDKVTRLVVAARAFKSTSQARLYAASTDGASFVERMDLWVRKA